MGWGYFPYPKLKVFGYCVEKRQLPVGKASEDFLYFFCSLEAFQMACSTLIVLLICFSAYWYDWFQKPYNQCNEPIRNISYTSLENQETLWNPLARLIRAALSYLGQIHKVCRTMHKFYRTDQIILRAIKKEKINIYVRFSVQWIVKSVQCLLLYSVQRHVHCAIHSM